MNKRIRITYSLILTVCLLLSILPGHYVAAAGMDNTSITESTDNSPTETKSASEESIEITQITPNILHEDVSLRKEYEKHFLMSDGSYQVALYNEPVHKMEDGKWVEIDNTLYLRTAADGKSQYATQNGLADITFSQN